LGDWLGQHGAKGSRGDEIGKGGGGRNGQSRAGEE